MSLKSFPDYKAWQEFITFYSITVRILLQNHTSLSECQIINGVPAPSVLLLDLCSIILTLNFLNLLNGVIHLSFLELSTIIFRYQDENLKLFS